MVGSKVSPLSGSLVSARATAAAAAGSLVSALSGSPGSMVSALSGSSLRVPRPRGRCAVRLEIAERALPVIRVRFAGCRAVIMRCMVHRPPTDSRLVGLRH